jgi:hypothetical protein
LCERYTHLIAMLITNKDLYSDFFNLLTGDGLRPTAAGPGCSISPASRCSSAASPVTSVSKAASRLPKPGSGSAKARRSREWWCPRAKTRVAGASCG